MEQADQTLHDFVLNLLSDSQALTAFEQDPAAVLDHAGLSDISASDVQEVIPLVIDYVPAHADALDAVLGRLPLDSVDTGQLGAIQQLRFVTQALGGAGLPGFDVTGSFTDGDTHGTYHLHSTDGGVWSTAGLTSVFGSGASSLGGDPRHGVVGSLWEHSPAGDAQGGFTLPGVPGLGGGLPSGFSALSDVTDALDSHVGPVGGSMVENVTDTANLVAGAAGFTSGALAAPDLATALGGAPATSFDATSVTSAVNSLTTTTTTHAVDAIGSVPAPAGAQTTGVHSVVEHVTSHLPVTGLGGLGDLGGHLPLTDPTHALSTVSGVVGDVTGSLGSHLPTGALGDVTSHLPAATDPTHASGSVSGSLGNVASHSAVTEVTGSTGTGSLLGTDHTDVGSDLNHVTSDLHLPSLF